MLARAHRLCRATDIQAVRREGRTWSNTLLTCRVLPRESGWRVTVPIGRKVGNAVIRNRIRRRLRELAREASAGWKDGFDLILGVRPAAAGASWFQLRAALQDIASRSGLCGEEGCRDLNQYVWPVRKESREAPRRDESCSRVS